MHRTTLPATLTAIALSLLLSPAVAAPGGDKGPPPGKGPPPPMTVKAHLKGYEEVPSVSTAGNGDLTLKIDEAAGSIAYELTYEDLQGTVTQSHIHFGQKSVAGSIVIWLCQTAANPAPAAVASITPLCPPSGPAPVSVSGTITSANVIAASTTSQLIAAGELSEVIAAIRAGVAYGNVHSNLSPGGEIRGQLH